MMKRCWRSVWPWLSSWVCRPPYSLEPSAVNDDRMFCLAAVVCVLVAYLTCLAFPFALVWFAWYLFTQ